MGLIFYWLIALAWIMACLLLGFFIRNKGSKNFQLKAGFMAILISYLFGIGIMAFALFYQ